MKNINKIKRIIPIFAIFSLIAISVGFTQTTNTQNLNSCNKLNTIFNGNNLNSSNNLNCINVEYLYGGIIKENIYNYKSNLCIYINNNNNSTNFIFYSTEIPQLESYVQNLNENNFEIFLNKYYSNGGMFSNENMCSQMNNINIAELIYINN